jgi:WD40 repeat protein
MRFLFPSALRSALLRGVLFLALCIFPLCGIPCNNLFAQSISLSSLDVSRFPVIRAQVRAFDAAGNRLSSSMGFTVREDGVQRTVTSFSCPVVEPRPFSAVLTIDVSGSMGQLRGQLPNTFVPLEIAKAAADAFIESIPNDGSECAITAFESSSYIMSNFTQDRAYLKSAISALFPLFGTNYNDAFLNPITGALPMIASAKHSKRAIIFLTDGLSGASADQVVMRAMASMNAQIYVITIGLPAPTVLKDIANRTGGRVFENVNSRDAAVQIYRELANTLRIDQPCTIEWTSEPTCNTNRRAVTVEHSQISGTIARESYAPPFGLSSLITIMPRGFAMGEVPVRTTQSREIILTLNSGAAPVQVQNIRSTDPAFTIPPSQRSFTLQPGQAQRINVSYTAPDSGYKFTTLQVEIGNGCSLDFYGTAGFPGVRPRVGSPDTLRLLQPNGGEEFLVGIDTVIRWRGVPPDEPVKLEYSIDAGLTWRLVDAEAKGLSYNWRVSNTPSTQCLMRVTQKNSSAALFSTDSLVVLYQNKSRPELGTHNNSNLGRGSALSAQFDKTAFGNELVTTGADGKAFLWNGWTGEPSSRAFDLGVRSQNGVALDAAYNRVGEIGVIFDGITENISIIPAVLPGDGFSSAVVRGNAPLRAIRFNPLVANQFVITPGDPQVPVAVYSFQDLGMQSRSITRDFTLDNSSGGVKIANFTSDGQWLYAAYDRQIRLWDLRQQGQFQSFPVTIWDGIPFGVTILYADAQLSASGLQIAVTCSDRSIRFLRVSATQTNQLEEFNRIEAPGGVTSIEKSTFNRTGQYLVSTAVLGGRGIGLVWDLSNPAQPLPLQNGPRHGSRVYTAFFSNDEPTTRVVTASEDGTAIIWFIREKLPLQEDQSDRVWSIVRPVPTPVAIDMRRVAVGSAKDSVCTVLFNQSKYEIPIVQAFLRSSSLGLASPFSIVSGNAPFSVSSNSNVQAGTSRMEFRFAPSVQGVQTDSIIFITASNDRLAVEIRGEGIQPALSAVNFNFGNVFVSSRRDTVITAIVSNTGATTVALETTLLSVSGVFSRGNDYPLLITLLPGASIELPFRFSPRITGLASASVIFTDQRSGQRATATLTGIGIQDGALLQADAIASPASAVCDTASFIVRLENIGNKDVVIPSTGASIRAANGAPSTEFVITSLPRTIPAGSTSAIVVQFRSQRIGTAQGFLTITSNSLAGDVLVSLVARVERDSLIYSDRFIDLGAVEPQQTTSKSFTIRNLGNAARNVWFDKPNALSAANSRFTISDSLPAFLLASNATARLRITFLGGQAGVTYNDYYVFGPLCPTGAGRSDTVRVSVTVNSRPQLRIVPPLTQSTTTCASSGTFTVRLTNIGTTDATMITTQNLTAPFQLVSQVPSTLRPRDTVSITIAYNLARSGTFTGVLGFTESSTGTVQTTLAVVKADVGFTISPNPRSFPTLEANMASTTTVTIVNNGSVPLRLAPALAGRVGDAGFSFSPSTDIPPYSFRQVTVSFAGGVGNRTFAAAFPLVQEFPAGMCRQTDSLRVTASTIGRTGELVLSDMVGNPGDKMQMTVLLRNRKNISIGTIITDILRTNVTMIFPQDPTPRGVHIAGERVIPVSWRVDSDDETVPIARLNFLALLGNDSLTAIRLMGTPENRVPGSIITTAPPGTNTCIPVPTRFSLPGTHVATFCVLRTRLVGGNSFVISSLGTVQIESLSPQPVVAEMNLTFLSLNAELYTLRITDALGQEYFPTKEIQAVQGRNEVTVQETAILPRGVYFVYLRSARELAARRFMIVR